jgi:hypothetical protein
VADEPQSEERHGSRAPDERVDSAEERGRSEGETTDG